MKARLQFSAKGPDGRSIWAVQLPNGRSRALEFVDELERTRPRLHKRLMAVLDAHSRGNTTFNEHVDRPLKGKRYHGLFEFKAKITGEGGARLIYFTSGSRTVLAIGCDKLKEREFRQEADKALAMMRSFEREGSFE